MGNRYRSNRSLAKSQVAFTGVSCTMASPLSTHQGADRRAAKTECAAREDDYAQGTGGELGTKAALVDADRVEVGAGVDYQAARGA